MRRRVRVRELLFAIVNAQALVFFSSSHLMRARSGADVTSHAEKEEEEGDISENCSASLHLLFVIRTFYSALESQECRRRIFPLRHFGEKSLESSFELSNILLRLPPHFINKPANNRLEVRGGKNLAFHGESLAETGSQVFLLPLLFSLVFFLASFQAQTDPDYCVDVDDRIEGERETEKEGNNAENAQKQNFLIFSFRARARVYMDEERGNNQFNLFYERERQKVSSRILASEGERRKKVCFMSVEVARPAILVLSHERQ